MANGHGVNGLVVVGAPQGQRTTKKQKEWEREGGHQRLAGAVVNACAAESRAQSRRRPSTNKMERMGPAGKRARKACSKWEMDRQVIDWTTDKRRKKSGISGAKSVRSGDEHRLGEFCSAGWQQLSPQCSHTIALP